MPELEQKFYARKELLRRMRAAKAEAKPQSVGNIIVEAGRMNAPVEIVYNTLDNRIERRWIEPFELKPHGKHIQLFAHCRVHHRTHSFVFDRIKSAKVKPNLKWESKYRWVFG